MIAREHEATGSFRALEKGASKRTPSAQGDDWKFLTGTSPFQRRLLGRKAPKQISGSSYIKSANSTGGFGYRAIASRNANLGSSSDFQFMSRNSLQLFPHSFSSSLAYRHVTAPISKKKNDLYGRALTSQIYGSRRNEYWAGGSLNPISIASERPAFKCENDLSITSLKHQIKPQTTQKSHRTPNSTARLEKKENKAFRPKKINLRSMTALPCLSKKPKEAHESQTLVKPSNQILKYKTGLQKDELSFLVKTAPPRFKLKQFSGKNSTSIVTDSVENILTPCKSPYLSPQSEGRFERAWLPILKKHQKRMIAKR